MPVSINGNTGVITGLAVGGLPDGIVDADMLASGVGGKILQVVSTNKTDTFSANIGKQSFSGAAISVSITPANSSNKIILVAKLTIALESDNDIGFALD